ncbi:hypothetical protein, partial [Thiolapillus sp.]|uniref:hypothetical protein n=1 Tax=Thiolapillus sp. TaxID=2017437 RepID=UPI003AF6D786
RSEAYFVFPLAQGTPGKQCGLAATGVYQPSLRSPWLAAAEDTLVKKWKPLAKSSSWKLSFLTIRYGCLAHLTVTMTTSPSI